MSNRPNLVIDYLDFCKILSEQKLNLLLNVLFNQSNSPYEREERRERKERKRVGV